MIILGTLNGAVSVGSDTLFGGSQFSSVGIGIAVINAAILSTIGSYFAWSRRSEGHRISSLNYAKLYRFLSIEMALPRDERMTPNDLLKYVKTEYDRLSEISPLIPVIINETFRLKFSDPKYDNISKPEDTNGLHPIIIYDIYDTDILQPLKQPTLPILPEIISSIQQPVQPVQQILSKPSKELSINKNTDNQVLGMETNSIILAQNISDTSLLLPAHVSNAIINIDTKIDDDSTI